MDTRSRIAQNLRRLRIERQISQEHLAVDAGVDRTYISGIENCVFNPSVDILDRIVDALSVDIAELFEVPPDVGVSGGLRAGRKPKR